MSVPATDVLGNSKQSIEALTNTSVPLEKRFDQAAALGDKLRKGDKNKRISTPEQLQLYVWYKLGKNNKEIPAKPNLLSFEYQIWQAKSNALTNALKDPTLTPEVCQNKYIAFILNVLNKHPDEVDQILKAAANPPAEKNAFNNFMGLFRSKSNQTASNSQPTSPNTASQGNPPLTAGGKSVSDPLSLNPDQKKDTGTKGP